MNDENSRILPDHSGPSDLGLRDAMESDKEFLRALYHTTRQDEVAQFGWPDEQIAAFLDMQHEMQSRSYAMQYPDAEHKIILWHRSPAGRIMTRRSGEAILLIDIALLPDFRGHGVGTDLINRLKNASNAVELSVAKINPAARRLYERLGFVVTGESDFNVSMKWTRPSE